MGKRSQVTPEQFDLVKMMVNAGIKQTMVAKTIGKSAVTVNRLLKYETLDAYHSGERAVRETYKSTRNVEQPFESIIPVQTEETVLPEPVAQGQSEQTFDFKLLNENLVYLANKMAGYAQATEALTIATYALRKTANGDNKSFWKK